MNKQYNAQWSIKSLQRSYCIKSMDSKTDGVVTNVNLEDTRNYYKTWNHLTGGKQVSSIFF